LKKNIKKIGLFFLVLMMPAVLYAGTPDTQGTEINGNWAALANNAKIEGRQFWLYLSIKDGQACMHNLYVKDGKCPSSCYAVSKGKFEAGKIDFSFTWSEKDKILIESWSVNGKPDGLYWVKYDLPKGCVHGQPTK